MKKQIAFLLKSICCCSHCTRTSCCQHKDKTEAVQPCNLSKRCKRKKGRRSPYIETPPKDEKVFTFFMKALSKSTITGVNRLASTKNIFRKTLWCLVSLFCLGGFLYQAFWFAVVYNCSPTDVVLRVENDGTLEFPSVTVCNNNR
ncbi:hypothetical protein AVEN_126439-1 [Araneus ventricosus]|uniref:Uncharacterized protein n=1 Tax=Araneus ventricosus TaxID=182803 RepID=A0A4Y2DH98_ARAVE|nr:hypothetical protein AVEN_126439-1 [Araneus ventricosus]